MTQGSEQQGWGGYFSAVLENEPPQAPVSFAGAPQVSATIAQAHVYSPEELDTLNALMRDPNNASIAQPLITDATQQGLRDVQTFARMIDGAFGGVVDSTLREGNSLASLNTGATDIGTMNAIGLQSAALENGTTTINQNDVDALKMQVQAITQRVLGQNPHATLEDVQKELGGIHIPADLQQVAQQFAQDTLSQQNFSLASGMGGPADNSGPSLANGLFTSAALVEAGTGAILTSREAEEEARRRAMQGRVGGMPSLANDSPFAPLVPSDSSPLGLAVLDLGKNNGQALDFVFDRGPGQTPAQGMELVAQMRANRPAGRELT